LPTGEEGHNERRKKFLSRQRNKSFGGGTFPDFEESNRLHDSNVMKWGNFENLGMALAYKQDTLGGNDFLLESRK
jgi:hypothetical protein